MNEEYGDIVIFPGFYGRTDMVMLFNADDVEKTFRIERSIPFRKGIEVLTHYRKKVRPDIYEEYGSLVTEYVNIF